MARRPEGELSRGLVESLIEKLARLTESMEKAAVAEFIEIYRHPRRLVYINFVSGIVRGFGIAVGFTVVGSLFLMVLVRLARLNLPVIGEFIAQLVRIVQTEVGVP